MIFGIEGLLGGILLWRECRLDGGRLGVGVFSDLEIGR
jgi:hypothetical protein